MQVAPLLEAAAWYLRVGRFLHRAIPFKPFLALHGIWTDGPEVCPEAMVVSHQPCVQELVKDVVLVKLSDVCAAEAAVGAVFSRGGRDEVREVSFDVNLDAGSRPLEVAEALKFVCHELVVGRVLQGQAVLKECPDFFWPNAAMSAAAGFGLAGLPAASGSRSAAHRGGIYRYQDALRPLMRRWPRHGNRQGCGGQNAVAAGG